MPKFNYLVFLFVLCFFNSFCQNGSINISGVLKEQQNGSEIPFATVLLKTEKDKILTLGTITNEKGQFLLSKISTGSYILEISTVGFLPKSQTIFVGTLSEYLDLGIITMVEEIKTLDEAIVTAKKDELDNKLDKKTFSISDNFSQSGGSVLQAMQNLPGVTVQDGKLQLRGNERVAILIDGKQTAMTGFGNQQGLDNLPASAIEKIEIISNPSAKYDANGNAGIINIIYKKNNSEGFNGKIGLAGGFGALWERKESLPNIRPQYQMTPKINPSLSLNYKKNKSNIFLQGDYLYTQTLNKNEFVERVYKDGETIKQQTKRNRNTHFLTTKTGVDWNLSTQNSLTISSLFGIESIIDRGDEPFFNINLTERLRLWQFLEDELKTTVVTSIAFQHKFSQPGHLLNIGFNYTFHREDEKYFFTNILPTFTGNDSFKLLSDEHVGDFNFDYIKPLRNGRFETGLKFRRRTIPTNMQFFQGLNSPLDINAGGEATYSETIPAVYSNYIFENKKLEAELGLRVEYVNLNYEVNPNHNTYKSGGYDYVQPFPNFRLGYKINNNNKLSFFYNRRVDRPNEVDIRIFPKYDDAEIIKVGNPNLSPQFTNSIELGYKTNLNSGYFYSSIFHRLVDGTITRIASTVPGSNVIYAVFQNAGRSNNSGLEMMLTNEISKKYKFSINLIAYRNKINAFSVENKYPISQKYSAEKDQLISGNLKFNNTFRFAKNTDLQLSMVYLAPDIIPQGRIYSRFSVDFGLKKAIQNGKAELFINANDLLNTMITKKEIQGQGFKYTITDYFETQVIRMGYAYKF
jgi:outer membrane receptor protein involved in Fe transport